MVLMSFNIAQSKALSLIDLKERFLKYLSKEFIGL